ncbi:MAG: sulfatase-like hydrolase/transferase [Puniceicoccaceae bacterium]
MIRTRTLKTKALLCWFLTVAATSLCPAGTIVKWGIEGGTALASGNSLFSVGDSYLSGSIVNPIAGTASYYPDTTGATPNFNAATSESTTRSRILDAGSGRDQLQLRSETAHLFKAIGVWESPQFLANEDNVLSSFAIEPYRFSTTDGSIRFIFQASDDSWYISGPFSVGTGFSDIDTIPDATVATWYEFTPQSDGTSNIGSTATTVSSFADVKAVGFYFEGNTTGVGGIALDYFEVTTSGNIDPPPPKPVEQPAWVTFVRDNGLSGNPSDDADGDGREDALEFVDGGNPKDPADRGNPPIVTQKSAGDVRFSTVEPNSDIPGLRIHAEWSDDPAAAEWNSSWDTETSDTSTHPDYDEVNRTVALGPDNRIFCRTRIEDPARRPNILLILADDLGYSDVGFTPTPEADIQTPKLDSLASQGVVFSSAYVVHPFCGPSRMGLMAGRYPHEFGGPYNLPNYNGGNGAYSDQGIPTSETLFSTLLQEVGYHTGIIGKWHLGHTADSHPNNRGFDYFYGFLGGGKNYFPPYDPVAPGRNDYRTDLMENGSEVIVENDPDYPGSDFYLTDWLSLKAVDFVTDAAADADPFFLFLSYNAPHTPLQAKNADLAALFGPSDSYTSRQVYSAMVYSMDRGIGQVVDALKATGQYDNTLIVFLSDNGGRTDTAGQGRNAPLRGRKGDTWEGGFRVPMIMHWPGVITSGDDYVHPVTALDFYPTFARLAGASIPEGKELDGKDIWYSLIADRSPRPGEPIYAVRYNVGFGSTGFTDVGIRQDQWKATLHRSTGSWGLYDVSVPGYEGTDLSGTYPEILSSMVGEGAVWAGDHIRPLWFDSTSAETEWDNRGMPHYDTTFVWP